MTAKQKATIANIPKPGSGKTTMNWCAYWCEVTRLEDAFKKKNKKKI